MQKGREEKVLQKGREKACEGMKVRSGDGEGKRHEMRSQNGGAQRGWKKGGGTRLKAGSTGFFVKSVLGTTRGLP